MEEIIRHAVYYAPAPGAFADRTAAWLGWDAEAARPCTHPDIAGLPAGVADLTAAPRKYGFHGTLKPPFRLADGQTPAGLAEACAALAARLQPVSLPALALDGIDGFLALVPKGDTTALAALAATVVRDLDRFRAPPTAAEIARRKPAALSDRQREHLSTWGYPYVMEDFRFHLTLTGNIGSAACDRVAGALWPWLGPVLPQPFVLADLCLFGERRDGTFRILHRYPLGG